MNTQYTVIQGRQIAYTLARIPNGQLELDPANPRLQYLVGQTAGNVTEARLDELIWAKDQVKALAQSIFQNGGIREAIIVQPTGQNKYRVREGNSRQPNGLQSPPGRTASRRRAVRLSARSCLRA
jgi:hypothetical protein